VTSQPALTATSSGQELLALREEVDRRARGARSARYILSLVRSTRMLAERTANPGTSATLNFGASPRASLALFQFGRASPGSARGLPFPPPSCRNSRPTSCASRLGLTYEADAEEITTDKIIAQLLERTPVPASVKG